MEKKFFVKDCTLAAIATGESATSIQEFKEILARIPTSSLYYHFWRRHFRYYSGHPELHNDFALWFYTDVHDHVLGERLGIIDPSEFSDLEGLREIILENIEQRIDEVEFFPSVNRENKFHFLRSIIVVFDTEKTISHPSELKTILPSLTTSSIFYHFIDARRRIPLGMDDFSFWILEHDPASQELIKKIKHIDPYFLSLEEQKQKLIEILGAYFS